jgi:RNA polymerase sigma factor (sigma-70 family)
MSISEPKFDSAVHDVQNDTDDDTAWVRLVYRYQSQITLWCRKLGLQLADAENVTQFATWLRRVTVHVARNYVRKQTKAATGSGDTEQMMRLQEVQDESESYWDRINSDADRAMLARALGRTRDKVTPDAWKVFELAAIQKVPGGEVAERLGVSAQSVYSARHRVMQVLREQMAEMAAEGE